MTVQRRRLEPDVMFHNYYVIYRVLLDDHTVISDKECMHIAYWKNPTSI